jgi:hypothetical protein
MLHLWAIRCWRIEPGLAVGQLKPMEHLQIMLNSIERVRVSLSRLSSCDLA